MATHNPWKTKQITETYDNPWIKVTHRDVETPGGSDGIYGVVHFKNIAVGIIPLDEEYNTWIVGQYRYTLNQYSWEIPEGGAPIGEPLIDAAKRELKEETGLTAKVWTPVIELHTSNSVTDEKAICYLAQGLSMGEAEPEDTEELVLRKLPFQSLFQMTMKGLITDAFSVASILKVKYLLDHEKL